MFGNLQKKPFDSFNVPFLSKCSTVLKKNLYINAVIVSKYKPDLFSLCLFFFLLFFSSSSHHHHQTRYLQKLQIMSKLASLAKKRALQKQQQQDSITLLDRLQTKPSEPVTPSSNPESAQPSLPLSKLASKAAKSKLEPSSKSAINSLRSRSLASNSSKQSSSNSPSNASLNTSSATSTPSIPSPIQIAPSIDYSQSFRKRSRPSSVFASLLTSVPESSSSKVSKKQRLATYSNFLYPIDSVSIVNPAFINSSPDDIIIEAQTNAKYNDETTKSLSGLKISDQKKRL